MIAEAPKQPPWPGDPFTHVLRLILLPLLHVAKQSDHMTHSSQNGQP